ncbi:hypothetical protein L1277_002208 [Okibacterium sp. HSC-33S16]|nr:hypothetical protein [Okibacterium sp. HSC-33S16]MCP2032109.1 hypothetical protein [Okibacterium sp. HSC-33S16]
MTTFAAHVALEARRPNALRGVAVFGYRRELRLLASSERCSHG